MTERDGARLTSYLLGSDLSETELLTLWANLRHAFPLLCGDPPPWRWLGLLSDWLLREQTLDSSFQPVSFHCDWSLQVYHDATDFLVMSFLSAQPQEVQGSYTQLLQDLMVASYHHAGVYEDTEEDVWLQARGALDCAD